MTVPAAAKEHSRFDDLWRPSHWNDEVGGKHLDRFAVGVLVFTVAWNLIANLWLPGSAWVLANLALAAVLVAAARRVGLSCEELGLRPDRVVRGLGVGAAAGGLVLAVLAIGVAVPAFRGWFDDPEIAGHSGATDAYFALVRIPLGTVVLEELLFRGVLLALALRRWKVSTAVLATAGIFGLWHVVPAAKNAHGSILAMIGAVLGTVVVTSIAGAIFVWLRLRANSLAAPAIAHIATNSLAYLAVVVALELR